MEPDKKNPTIFHTKCCIAGAGPAGMVLGYLLARAGIDTMVLEKHPDFFRDFRGDTIHPSTLELLGELGLLEDFLTRPHQQATELTGMVGSTEIKMADFSHLKTRCRFIALMPQWDFLKFFETHARHYPTFHLRMNTDVRQLIFEEMRVVGVRAETPDGAVEIRAELVVGADGRRSTVRAQSQLAVEELGAPMDVLWLRLPRLASDRKNPLGRFDRGKIFVMIERGDYWQCGYVIPKGDFEKIQVLGLPAFREQIARIEPKMRNRVSALKSWDDVKLLTVAVNRMPCWFRPGLLCIGDAAHAMSPIGGVGINLAIQDAVAAANALSEPLRAGCVTRHDLEKVQSRRELPTRVTQQLQLWIQNRVIGPSLARREIRRLPWSLRLFRQFPVLRRIPARLVGVGIRPEHILTPDAFRNPSVDNAA